MLAHTILIAEDDPIQRHTIRRILESEIIAEVIEASDGSEALQHLKRHERKTCNSLSLSF